MQLGRWIKDGLLPIRMAVNLSSRQFNTPGLVEVIAGIIKNSGISAELLQLEITESVLMQQVGTTVDTIFDLHKMGIRFSIDDFGTGYSSLSYLKRFPIDEVKIDKSFIRDLTKDSDDAAIVQAIIVMCESLNIDVIAEGVETDAQKDYLFDSGCENIQGFLISQPEPADEIIKCLLSAHLNQVNQNFLSR